MLILSQATAYDQAIWYLAKLINVKCEDINSALDLLANHSEETPAYIRFTKPKKSGGQREIYAPVDDLKYILGLIYHEVLATYPLNYHVYGFRPRRTIVDNAMAHLETGANYLVNYDIKDFFPSTPIDHIRRVCRMTAGKNLLLEGVQPGVIDELVEILAHLTTLRHGRSFAEVLPVGSPTSPCLANHVLNEFDLRLYWILGKIARRLSTTFTYTRWGDDLSISSPTSLPNSIFGIVPSLLSAYGYKINQKKFRTMARGMSKHPLEVTGIVIGEGRLLLSDARLSDWRASMWNILCNQPLAELTTKQVQYLRGIIGIVRMIYGDDLAPKVVRAVESARHQVGSSYVDAILFEKRWRERLGFPSIDEERRNKKKKYEKILADPTIAEVAPWDIRDQEGLPPLELAFPDYDQEQRDWQQFAMEELGFSAA